MEILVQTGAGELVALTHLVRRGKWLIFDGLELEGSGAGTLGLRTLRGLIREYGRQEHVEKVTIRDARRTSGANPGKIPRSMTIRIRE